MLWNSSAGGLDRSGGLHNLNCGVECSISAVLLSRLGWLGLGMRMVVVEGRGGEGRALVAVMIEL